MYTPLDTLPTCGDRLQFTLVLLEPLTVGVTVTDWPADKDAVVGETLTETVGLAARETVAVAFLVESAELVAVMVIVCALETEDGAV